MYHFEENDVVMPIAVLEELDNPKGPIFDTEFWLKTVLVCVCATVFFPHPPSPLLSQGLIFVLCSNLCTARPLCKPVFMGMDFI